jgi:hypothetical protein
MARIEDGIFTKGVVLTASATPTAPGDRDINEAYPLNSETRKANAADVQSGAIGTNGSAVTSTNDDMYVNGNPGVAAKLYTSGVGSNSGLETQFKLLDGSVVTIELFEGTMIPLATIGCNRSGILVLR